MVPSFHLHQKTDAPCSESFLFLSSFSHQSWIILWRITQTFFFLSNVQGSLTLSEICETIPMQQSHWCVHSFQSPLISSLYPELVGLHMVPSCPFLENISASGEFWNLGEDGNWRWREAVCAKERVGCVNASAGAFLLFVSQSNQTSVGCSAPGLACPISPQDWQNLETRESRFWDYVQSEQRNCQKWNFKIWLVLSRNWSKSASLNGRFKLQSASTPHRQKENNLTENFWLTLLLSRGELSKLIVFDRWGLSSFWYRR